ncbi:alpha/beta hydrolase [Szabonella alba]|uniref:Alpha/beta hydrolase n=1 Tax=Szabonella alba TaxID=2804194 RepID=A0A8K0V7T1_9RHOB|nr:alpha/beta hydrolase [Szabonella alba]MBL4917062.1 alpha/beta hydrolase [Szabonella alba]
MRDAMKDEGGWPRRRLDADYTARDCVSADDFARIITDYATLSLPARDLPGRRPGIAYDPVSDERMDVFGAGQGGAAFLFIHGGYWRALSRGHSAFMAPMLAARGIATAVPDYTLAPAAGLTEITRQMRTAFAHLWHNAGDLGIDRRRIVVGGSSAGGHLAAALAMPGWQAEFGLPHDAVHAAMPVSGLFELAPIAASHVQDWMSLTPEEVQRLSPARHIPGTAPSLVALAEGETAGFTRQSAAYAAALDAECLTIPGRNHFDVILDLADAESGLSRRLLGLLER